MAGRSVSLRFSARQLAEAMAVEMDTIVLLADHEMRRRHGLRRFLLRSGFLVTVASDGLETLSEMVALSPDVLVVAWDLPCCGYAGIIRRLNLGLPVDRTPLVLVLGDPVADRESRSSVAAHNWLPEPLDEQALLDRILAELPLEVPDVCEDLSRIRCANGKENRFGKRQSPEI